MTLPMGFGKLDWSDWFRGLMSGFISGGANAVVGGTVVASQDPGKFAIGSSPWFWLVGSTFLAGGILSALNFLRQKSFPDAEK